MISVNLFEDGTVVETRDGCKYFVTGNGLWNFGGFRPFYHIRNRKDYEVVKKYEIVENNGILDDLFDDKNLILVWWKPSSLTKMED